MTIELRSTIFGKEIPGTTRRLKPGDNVRYKVEEGAVMGYTVVSDVEGTVVDRDTLKFVKTNPILAEDDEDPNRGRREKVLFKEEITGVRLPKRYPFVRRVFRWIPDEEK